MKEGVLEQRGCSFQVDKLSTFQELIFNVLDVGMPKLGSTFHNIKGPHLRGESYSAFPTIGMPLIIIGVQDLR